MSKQCRSAALAVLTAAAVLTTSACGSTESAAQDGEGIADEINLAAVHDLTGPWNYAGVGANKGAELAIKEINSEEFLGDGVTLTMETTDTAGEIDRAVSAMSETMLDQDIAAILGPFQGQQAAAVSASVNQRKVPTVFTQAGADGVVTGDYTFRITPPMESYYDVAMDWLATQGHRNVAMIYNATYPTFALLGGEIVPQLANERDIAVEQVVKTQQTTQDFTSQAQSMASEDPDAILMLLDPTHGVTFLSQLRQSGYEGQVIGILAHAGGSMSEAGSAADGLVYPVPFSPLMEHEASEEFTKSFRAEHGEDPDVYAAEGYDAIWWIARAIKASGDSSRDGIQSGLAEVGRDGFVGAQGEISFEEGQDARVPGAMIRWENGKETLVD